MFKELDGDQIRIQTNAIQTFEGWREAHHDFRHAYQGRMNWSRVNGVQYLYRINGKVRKSLGPRSPETERIKDEYSAQRKKLRTRRNRLQTKLKELAPINRAYRLGRVPKIAKNMLGLKFSAKDLSALPLRLTQHAKKRVASSAK